MDAPYDHTPKRLQAVLAQMELRIDLLETELTYLDKMLINAGFEEGISTLKIAMEEIADEDSFKSSEDVT